jgi:methyltransferase (TIGR00027 family)
MTVRRASRTALGVAALRAVHQLADGEPKILHDPIAARLLNPDVLGAISTGAARTDDPAIRALRSRVVLRARYAEDRLALAAQRGVRQCVILGAGLDTLAYRQPDWARNLSLFEVDHPASQADKRARLRRAGVPPPANLQFVPIDFEIVSLREGLRASTLNFTEPAFFSCLGVFVYLTRKAVDAVFELVAGFPAGSEIAFTYATPRASSSAMAAGASDAGEPWRTYMARPALKRGLHALGFSSISFLDHEQAMRTYFPERRRDGLTAPRRGSIAAAIVG